MPTQPNTITRKNQRKLNLRTLKLNPTIPNLSNTVPVEPNPSSAKSRQGKPKEHERYTKKSTQVNPTIPNLCKTISVHPNPFPAKSSQGEPRKPSDTQFEPIPGQVSSTPKP